jgi:chemotaxis protein MotB
MRNVVIVILWALLLIVGFFAHHAHRQKTASEQALVASQSQLVELEEKASEFNQKRAAAFDRIARLEAASRKLKADLQAARKATGEAGERLRRLQAEVERLNAALAEKDKEMAALEASFSQEEAASAETISEKSRRFAELQRAHKALAARVSEAGDTIQRLQNREKELLKQLSAEKKANRQTLADLEGFSKSEPYLQAQLAGALKSLNESEAKNRGLTAELEEVRNRMTRLEGKLAESTAEFAKLADEKDSALNRADRIKQTYEALVSGLREDVDKKQATIEAFEDKVRVRLVDRVLFKSGHSSVTAEGRASLKNVAGALQDMQGYTIRVSGHTDDVPIGMDYRDRYPTNWELSAARAAAVVRYFVEELGWDGSRLQAIGHSYFQPVAGNDTEEGRAQNRRVEISVIPN